MLTQTYVASWCHYVTMNKVIGEFMVYVPKYVFSSVIMCLGKNKTALLGHDMILVLILASHDKLKTWPAGQKQKP